MTPVISYQTSNFTDLKPEGQALFRFPLPSDSVIRTDAYAFTQKYSCRIDAWIANFGSDGTIARNTPASAAVFGLSDANAILTDWSQPTSMGGGLVTFSATFSRVPASWDDFKSSPYTFPGFPGIQGQNGSRNGFTDVVVTRIHHDYYLIDPLGKAVGVVDSGSPGTLPAVASTAANVVANRSLIPSIKKSFFVAVVPATGLPDFTSRTMSIVPAGGKIVGSLDYYQTLPQLANYQSWIANALAAGWATTPWDGTTDNGTFGQLVAMDSQTSVYAGNIIDRQTIYVLAK